MYNKHMFFVEVMDLDSLFLAHHRCLCTQHNALFSLTISVGIGSSAVDGEGGPATVRV